MLAGEDAAKGENTERGNLRGVRAELRSDGAAIHNEKLNQLLLALRASKTR